MEGTTRRDCVDISDSMILSWESGDESRHAKNKDMTMGEPDSVSDVKRVES